MALKTTLLLGQRSRPLAFAGISVLRPSPLKNRLELLVLIRRTARGAMQFLGRVPQTYGLPQDNAYALLKYGAAVAPSAA